MKSKVGYLLSGPTSTSYTTDGVDNHIHNVVTMHTSLGQTNYGRTHIGIKNSLKKRKPKGKSVRISLDQFNLMNAEKSKVDSGEFEEVPVLVAPQRNNAEPTPKTYWDHRDSNSIGISRKRYRPHSPCPYYRKPGKPENSSSRYPEKCDKYRQSPRSPSPNLRNRSWHLRSSRSQHYTTPTVKNDPQSRGLSQGLRSKLGHSRNTINTLTTELSRDC